MDLRQSTWIFFVIGILALAAGLYTYGDTVRHILLHESRRTARLQLSALTAELSNEIREKREAVAAVADNPILADSIGSSNNAALQTANRYCDTVSQAMLPSVVYLMDADGRVVASSNRHEPTSFLGKNYGFRDYFREALTGRNTVQLALGVTSRERGVYYASPVTVPGETASPVGVLVVKRSIETIDQEFRELGHLGEILLVSPSDVVFASTVSEWLYGTTEQKSPAEQARIERTRRFGSGPWPWIGLTAEGENRVTSAEGGHFYRHVENMEAFSGWKILYLHDLDKTDELIVSPLVHSVLISVLPGVVILMVVSLVLFVSIQRRIGRERRLVDELTAALDEIKTIRGILPICSYCKKIRTDEGAWDQIEAYISQHTEASFSHGICPECEARVYKELGLGSEE